MLGELIECHRLWWRRLHIRENTQTALAPVWYPGDYDEEDSDDGVESHSFLFRPQGLMWSQRTCNAITKSKTRQHCQQQQQQARQTIFNQIQWWTALREEKRVTQIEASDLQLPPRRLFLTSTAKRPPLFEPNPSLIVCQVLPKCYQELPKYFPECHRTKFSLLRMNLSDLVQIHFTQIHPKSVSVTKPSAAKPRKVRLLCFRFHPVLHIFSEENILLHINQLLLLLEQHGIKWRMGATSSRIVQFLKRGEYSHSYSRLLNLAWVKIPFVL